jgi:diacylglycerol kinase family enzyme
MRSAVATRLFALLALVAWLLSLAALVLFAVDHLLDALGTLAATLVGIGAAWFALVHRGLTRLLGSVVAVVAIAGAVVLLAGDRAILELIAYLVALGLAVGATRFALRPTGHAPTWVPGARPGHPVLLMNPWSGGGKVERFKLVDECENRGIEPVVLERGDDLRDLARAAVARGADALGMAGGDGSQAIVAGVASENDLPHVCVPAGTRNHLALDLGIDRDDVVGALDAYGEDGLERRVDLATVNGSVFVNNVSLGVYASIVQSDHYRDDKVGTTLRMLPELLGPEAKPFDIGYTGPDGSTNNTADLLMVSNDAYELDRLFGMGTRPKMDAGELGIVAVRVEGAGAVAQFLALEAAGRAEWFSGWRSWTAPEFVVESGEPVPAGIDGESLTLDPPLHFESRPRALRVRIAPHHPGRSPAAMWPRNVRTAILTLARAAFGPAHSV